MNQRRSRSTTLHAAFILLIMAISSSASATSPPGALVHQLGTAGEIYQSLTIGGQGGELRLFYGADPSGFNPVVTHEAAVADLCSLFLSGLLDTYGVSGEYYGNLAASWEISEDGTQLMFYLREHLVWSDGVPFTSSDVVFTYNDLHLNGDVMSSLRDSMRLPNGEYPVFTAIDDHTVVVQMSVLFRPIMQIFRCPILPAHILAQSVHKLNPDVAMGSFNAAWSADTDPSELVGLGPFLLNEYVPGQHVILERNPHYYQYDQSGTQLPYLDRLVLHILGSPDGAVLKFANHEIDAVRISGSDIPFLLPREVSDDFTIYTGGSGSTIRYLSVNQDIEDDLLRQLFRDLAFRRALAHSCDRSSMANLIWAGDASLADSPIRESSPFFRKVDCGEETTSDACVRYSYDLEVASDLLNECGVTDSDGDGWRELEDGRELEFTIVSPIQQPTTSEMVAILAADLRTLGVRVVHDPVDWGSYVNRILMGNWQAILVELSAFEEPHSSRNVFAADGGFHFWHFSASKGDATSVESRIDELYELGVQTLELDEAFEIYSELQLLLLEEDLGLIPLLSPGRGFAVHNRFGNSALFSELFDYNSPEILKLIYEIRPR